MFTTISKRSAEFKSFVGSLVGQEALFWNGFEWQIQVVSKDSFDGMTLCSLDGNLFFQNSAGFKIKPVGQQRPIA